MSNTNKSSIQKERPLGISILGIIFIIFGIWMAITAAMLGAVTAILGSYAHMMNGVISSLGGATALFIGIFAVIEFAIAWALFSGKKLGRMTVIGLAIVDLVAHSSTLVIGNLFAIPHIILDLLVLFYMWIPNVATYFNQK
ncbi:MAG TPA: hypothetical protein VD689_02920 [Nitrosopumilaceae archaeon]|nr:hypothetical protein [Nitrosopumilaceae archaeon]